MATCKPTSVRRGLGRNVLLLFGKILLTTVWMSKKHCRILYGKHSMFKPKYW